MISPAPPDMAVMNANCAEPDKTSVDMTMLAIGGQPCRVAYAPNDTPKGRGGEGQSGPDPKASPPAGSRLAGHRAEPNGALGTVAIAHPTAVADSYRSQQG